MKGENAIWEPCIDHVASFRGPTLHAVARFIGFAHLQGKTNVG